MATVAEVMDDVAEECSVSAPNAWVSSSTASISELKRFLRQTADELLDRVDWPDPITADTVITGTGAETYDLPGSFKRLTRDPLTVYELTTTRRAGVPVNSNGAWTHLKQIGSAGGDRYYRLSGDEAAGFKISFYRNPGASESITVSYVSKNWMRNGSTLVADWTDEAAVLLLPRKVVEMGVIWRWRRRKGLPFTDRLAEYEINVERLANDYRGIRTINFGGRPAMKSPFDIPVPDIIPTA